MAERLNRKDATSAVANLCPAGVTEGQTAVQATRPSSADRREASIREAEHEVEVRDTQVAIGDLGPSVRKP